MNLGVLESRGSFNERRDCVVRAMAVALDLDYKIAHRFCEKRGRKPKEGTNTFQVLGSKSKVIKGRRIAYRSLKTKSRTGVTVRKFLKTHTEGRFICIKYKHAFAVINGSIYGQSPDNSIITHYYRVNLPGSL